MTWPPTQVARPLDATFRSGARPAGGERARVGPTSIYVSGHIEAPAAPAPAKTRPSGVLPRPREGGRTVSASAARRGQVPPAVHVAASFTMPLRRRVCARGLEVRRPESHLRRCTSAGGLKRPPPLQRVRLHFSTRAILHGSVLLALVARTTIGWAPASPKVQNVKQGGATCVPYRKGTVADARLA